jgi:hypothetical protein
MFHCRCLIIGFLLKAGNFEIGSKAVGRLNKGNYTKLAGHTIKRITTQLINLHELLCRTSHRFS